MQFLLINEDPILYAKSALPLDSRLNLLVDRHPIYLVELPLLDELLLVVLNLEDLGFQNRGLLLSILQGALVLEDSVPDPGVQFKAQL